MKKLILSADKSDNKTSSIGLEHELDAHVQMSEILLDISQQEQQVDKSLQVVQALEEFQEVVQCIEQPSIREAALIQVFGDALVSGTDADPNELTPSMEDVNGSGVLNRAAQAVAKIIKYIKEAIAKMVKSLLAFFGFGRTAVQNQEARADKLDKKLKDMPTKLDPNSINMTASFLINQNLTAAQLRERVEETLSKLTGARRISQYVVHINTDIAGSVGKAVEAFLKKEEPQKGYRIDAVRTDTPGLGKKIGSKTLKSLQGTIETWMYPIANTGGAIQYCTVRFSAGRVKDFGAFIDELGEAAPPVWVNDDDQNHGDKDSYEIKFSGKEDIEATIEAALNLCKKIDASIKEAETILQREEALAEELTAKLKLAEQTQGAQQVARLANMNLNVCLRAIQAAKKNVAKLTSVSLTLNSYLITASEKAVNAKPQSADKADKNKK